MFTIPRLPVADPKPPDCGPENTGWLKALKNSARKSTEVSSVIFVFFVMDRSQFCWKGPRAIARREPRLAELIDLYCDGEPKDRSLDQGASVALPHLR
jgi:hypothetical protein